MVTSGCGPHTSRTIANGFPLTADIDVQMLVMVLIPSPTLVMREGTGKWREVMDGEGWRR